MRRWLIAVVMGLAGGSAAAAGTSTPGWLPAAGASLETELVARHGEGQRGRIHRGLAQVSALWRITDGDRQAFEGFVRTSYAGDPASRDALFERFQHNLEMLDGHLNEINREFRNPIDLAVGTIQPFDEAFGAYDPRAHVLDDFFANKLAFTVLLNFPLTTLQERLDHGKEWTRRQWAEARLAERYGKRIPADVTQTLSDAAAAADQYIARYNIWMHHLLEQDGQRLFPPKLRLLSHWNLRDQIKADYGDAARGLAKQRTIAKVMERIVLQTIPEMVVDNPAVDWNPWTNEVTAAAAQDADDVAPLAGAPSNKREPDTRYERLLADFRAQRRADPYSPTAPTHIARRFDEDRQIPEERMQAMLEQVLGSPLVPQVAALIRQRLGRDLEPFDIWYNGFLPRGQYPEAQLDAITAKRYPTAAAYEKDIPNLLRKLGFSDERARYLAANIVVDPARGSGHALGANMRSAKTHLRTRVEPTGMNYKGYNIAVHEMGHNVEQTFSLNNIDHTLLQGVPNTAFTEALAFVFQNRDLELLGLSKPDAKSEALKTLNDFWATYEIAGVALVDMGVWHWMYNHEDAPAALLRDATVAIARDVWNKYYAPVLGQKDVVLLGIYSHMINNFLYLPDYPLGHMIAFQIEQQIEHAGTANRGKEFERMATTGRVTPDEWMIKATGKPVGPEALLEATKSALATVGGSAAK
jgi:hypothetical protein